MEYAGRHVTIGAQRRAISRLIPSQVQGFCRSLAEPLLFQFPRLAISMKALMV